MNTFVRTLALLVVFALGIGYCGMEQDQRAACRDRQRQWDGQVVYTKFLAHQFHATRAQLAGGLHELEVEIGHRPSC